LTLGQLLLFPRGKWFASLARILRKPWKQEVLENSASFLQILCKKLASTRFLHGKCPFYCTNLARLAKNLQDSCKQGLQVMIVQDYLL